MNGKNKWNRHIEAIREAENAGTYYITAESEREVQGQMAAALIIVLASGIGFVVGALVVAWLCGLI